MRERERKGVWGRVGGESKQERKHGSCACWSYY